MLQQQRHSVEVARKEKIDELNQRAESRTPLPEVSKMPSIFKTSLKSVLKNPSNASLFDETPILPKKKSVGFDHSKTQKFLFK